MFGSERGELRELLVDETEGGGEVVGVDVGCEETADVAWNDQYCYSRLRACRSGECDVKCRLECIPRPPMMRTAGLSCAPAGWSPIAPQPKAMSYLQRIVD